MADNPFYVEPANPLQALLIGQRSYDAANEAQQQRVIGQARQQAAQAIGAGDYQTGIRTLLGAGLPQDAQMAHSMLNAKLTREHQAVQDARQAQRDIVGDQHWSAEHGLRQTALNKDKYVVKEVTDPNTGGTTLVRVKTEGTEGPINTGIAPSTPNNPFSSGGKFNNDQGKAAGFTDRMLQSESILSGIDGGAGVQGAGTSAIQGGLSKIPVAGNFLVSEDRQKYNQAKADFINAQLRRESGAAIGQSEFTNADKQYFPVPGDTAAVIKQKAANRRAAIEAMGREGGPSYKPKSAFNDTGGVVSYGTPTPTKNPKAPDSAFPAPPKIGEVRGGYEYKGGNPGEPSNWAQVQ